MQQSIMCILYVAMGPCSISLTVKESLAWKMLKTPDLGHMFQAFSLWDDYKWLLKAFFRPLAHLRIVHNVKRRVPFILGVLGGSTGTGKYVLFVWMFEVIIWNHPN